MVKNTPINDENTTTFTGVNPMHNIKTCENIVEEQINLYKQHLEDANKYTTEVIYKPLFEIFLDEINRDGAIYKNNAVSTAEEKKEERAMKIALDIQKNIINEIKAQLKDTQIFGLFGGKKKAFIDHCEKKTYDYAKQDNNNFTIYYKYNNSIPTLQADIRYIRLFNNDVLVPIETIFDIYINIRKPKHKYHSERPKIYGGKRKQTKRHNSNRKRTSKRKN